MGKIGILTFQNTFNFGAALQNYALYKVLEGEGFEPVVVNYRCREIERNELYVPVFRPKAILRYLSLRPKARLFHLFKKSMAFTASCGRDDIAKVCKDFDYIIVGSDQVWNTRLTNSDPTFFLDFMVDSDRCKTYAASMGYGALPECEFDVRPLISRFSSILVREKSALDTIAHECPDAPTPHVVLDPTLLVQSKVWKSLANKPDCASNGTYILIYDVSESDATFEAARKLAKKMGAKLIRIQSYDLSEKPGVKSILNIGPGEYLGLFAGAEATVVSSFHGLCFSIINHKDFLFAGQAGKANTNSRAYDLMSLLGIQNRTVQDYLNGTDLPIDWGDVEKRLSSLRADSIALLRESLGIEVES